MHTIGLVDLTGALDYTPESGDGWKLIRLAVKRGNVSRSALSTQLTAIAFLGSSIKRDQLAEKALLDGKHVLVDFPTSLTVENARKIGAIANETGLCVYSPNLLNYEPGFREVKRINASTGSMTSLTVNCGVSERLISPEFSTKLVQLLDVMEWLEESKIRSISAEKCKGRSGASALVALVSFANSTKGMLNLYSSPSARHRLWVDVVFKESFLHIDPYAQSIRITSFQGKAVEELNWASSPLISLVEDFTAQIKQGKQQLDLVNLERLLKLAASVIAR